ncbi:MAG: ankyrin repeat domain-containing protein [Candidatus Omnitrophica bacterium]|nr:ankyrin repeat domain-containing protein [Candidatus Omnitrophota bacterium]MBU1997530.1 ankyrin repeat domain-containing protein [Candidatus Omnitrophota bacterium]MBU4332876.1 ankyrin repeat domain-containing protein [Candidatus Omnitrophota bacterium]
MYQKKFVLIHAILFFTAFFILPKKVIAQYEQGGLFSAARSGNIEVVKALLAQESDQHKLDQALGAAVAGNKIKMIEYLIKEGADVNHISSFSNSVLINAIALENMDAAEVLIRSGADVNVKGLQLVIHGISVNWQWTPLMTGVYKGDLNIVKLLIQKGAKVNEKGWSRLPEESETAADIAAYSGNLEILKYLMKKQGKLSKSAIFLSARSGCKEVVEYLLANGADINGPGPYQSKTLLMEASWWGQVDIVKMLIEQGAEVNLINENGYTALSEAISNANEDFLDQFEIVKILVENGADIHLTGMFKMTPLMLAIKSGDQNIIDYLKEKGAQE